MSLEDEIHAQPAAIERARRAAQRQVPSVRDLLTGHDIAHVVIAARGTSDNAARWAQYLWGRRTGLPVALATPSLYADGAGLTRGWRSGRHQDLHGPAGLARCPHRRAARGARPVLVTDRDVAEVLPTVRLPTSGPLGGAFTATVSARLATVAATRDAGRDPDDPADLSKVTRTR